MSLHVRMVVRFLCKEQEVMLLTNGVHYMSTYGVHSL